MTNMPDILRMAQELAQHAGARQAEIARNVANADTPGYRAKDLVPFTDIFRAQPTEALRTTRAGHQPEGGRTGTLPEAVDAGGQASPNGNTVSVEGEILKTAEVRRDHELAVSIYRASLDMMRAAIGRGR